MKPNLCRSERLRAQRIFAARHLKAHDRFSIASGPGRLHCGLALTLPMATDAKIQDIALAYIREAVVGGCSRWPSTTIGVLHPSLVGLLSLDDGELVLASAFFSPDSWYAFTTRRIVSQFRGTFHSLDPSHGIRDDFGNFKGYGPDRHEDTLPEVGVVRREVASITANESQAVVRFEFATWEASMIPIYAARYWVVKHPAIDKLMTMAERESYRSRKG
jgi:hypothetical protein